jgi:signal transduction histidine kinase
MVAVGLLTIGAVALHMLANVAILGKPLAWTYDPSAPKSVVVPWDKLLTMLVAALSLVLARSKAGIRWGRPLVSSLVLIVCVGMTVDDVANQDPGFSAGYVAVALFAAIVAMPYKPWETLVLGLAGIGSLSVGLSLLPPLLGLEGYDLVLDRLIFLFILVVLLTGMSGILYHSRYRQYEARSRAEALLRDLKSAQRQLVHTEKMASLGKLTAGVAHEIKNPLNFINNFSLLSARLTSEIEALVSRRASGADEDHSDEIRELVADLRSNQESIRSHGERIDSIVRSMLAHSRPGDAEAREVDLNELVDEYVSFSYHGMRSRATGFDVHLEKNLGTGAGKVAVVVQDIGRVLINLLTNAFESVAERAASAESEYRPTVQVATSRKPGWVEIRVADNGTGIPLDVRPRIFEPFFTTRPAGHGTGLGLSLSYEIVVDGHGGTLELTESGPPGAEFIVRLPVN